MMIQKIGVLGSGQVGQALANGFLRHGYDVMIGSHTPSKLSEWKVEAGEHGQIGSFEDTASPVFPHLSF